ncbi:hypothetical protein BU17DRAFT_36833 [Hysterangium stoloniferum]|nr:hypothetical protein BU17DRAFT_36833 [Hysterangium stoloniferum]
MHEGDEDRHSAGRISLTRSRSITINPINSSETPASPHRSPSDDPHRELNPRLSPLHTRQNASNDPDARERQRTMDVDLAMQMSRARRGSASVPVPPRQQSHGSNAHAVPSPLHSSPDNAFPFLSPHEEETMHTARSGGPAGDEADHNITRVLLPTVDEDTLGTDMNNQVFNLDMPGTVRDDDANLLYTLNQGLRSDLDVHDASNALPVYQPSAYRSNFDYSHMESFSHEEKQRLGISAPARQRTLLPHAPSQDQKSPLPMTSDIGDQPSALDMADLISEGPSENRTEFSRLRQRKLSQSTSAPGARRGKSGKLALFEGNVGGILGPPPPSFVPSDGRFAAGPSGWGLNPSLGQGHDRPYRFSFYSNTLSATIHARSLSELPAEGQSFEELFSGSHRYGRDQQPESNGKQLRGLLTPPPRIVPSPTIVPDADGGLGPPPEKKGRTLEDDWEGNTWWLDVLSPTDDEMRMLSKVFSIHPLTTEDIQMEEAREKIELFRNYYLVCFRSFDQDQYSPTYLEPVNMYIIVFREGTLSFHFQPTPHPQNVRRRITQLKDYISVTSDWISYALIDDITDAFGPLIQSIEYEVDSIDELVLILKEAEQSDMLRRIGTCRKKVMGLLRLMGNKADVVKGLAKRCNENWSVAPKSDIGLYLSDIQDHLITMTQNLNHYEKILSRSHSNYLAQISIEMTDANNQINDVLSKLTALGTVLIPMNLITGLWGMNVHVPGQDVNVRHFILFLESFF